MRKLFIIISAPLIFVGSVHAAVNINTATQEELQTLSGITSSKAKATSNIARRRANSERPRT